MTVLKSLKTAMDAPIPTANPAATPGSTSARAAIAMREAVSAKVFDRAVVGQADRSWMPVMTAVIAGRDLSISFRRSHRRWRTLTAMRAPDRAAMAVVAAA